MAELLTIYRHHWVRCINPKEFALQAMCYLNSHERNEPGYDYWMAYWRTEYNKCRLEEQLAEMANGTRTSIILTKQK